MKKIRLGDIGLNHQNGIECILCFAIKKKIHNIWSFNLQLSFCYRTLFILAALDFSVQDHVLSLNLLLIITQATAAYYYSSAVPFIISY